MVIRRSPVAGAPAVSDREVSPLPRLPARAAPLHRGRALAAFACLSLFGCGTVEYSEESRRAVRTVSVGKDVEELGSISGNLPSLEIDTRGTIWYSTWFTAPVGMVYDVIDWSENKRRKANAFQRKMRSNGVEVGRVVRREFVGQILGAGIFDSVLNWGGDARFRLRVEYGLSDGLGARGTWKPWLEVEGVLVDRDDRILWKKAASVSSYDERLPEFHEPFRNPEGLQRAFAKAARIVTSELTEHLKSG